MNAIALLLVASTLASPPEPPAPPVQLVPFRCATVSDHDVRAILRVELRDRLLDETAATAAVDVRLVSVACAGNLADIVVVGHAEASHARRQVPLGAVPPEARARNVAVAIAELLRAPGIPEPPRVSPPTPPPSPETDDPAKAEVQPTTPLELVEPLILMPLGDVRRVGMRTRAGEIDVPSGMETPNFFVLSLEPFLDVPLGRGTVLSLIVPVTWTEGPSTSSWGHLGNPTAAIRYASGDRLRVGLGAALSVNAGDAHAAQAESNLFEIDRFRDGSSSLRLQAGALWRAERLYLQGEAATLFVADDRGIGTLVRGGLAGGLALSGATLGVEYVVLSDAFDDYFASTDHFVQALIVGTRVALSAAATLGVHVHLALDQGPNLGAAGVVSAAWRL